MAAMRGPRVQVGSATWVADERKTAVDIAKSEADEFAFSARNDFDWLNEHMADVFNENDINVAEIFKTPGKLRGKTPRTARKLVNNTAEPRVPLSDVFSSATKNVSSPFAQQLNRLQSPIPQPALARSPLASRTTSPLKPVPTARSTQAKPPIQPADSGYYGSQSQDAMDIDHAPQDTQPTQAATPTRYADINDHVAFHTTPEAEPASPTVTRTMQSPTRTFQTAREEQTTRPLPEVTGSVSPVLHRSPIRSPMKQTVAYPMISSPARAMHSSSPKKSSPLKPMVEEAEEDASKTPFQDAHDAEDGTPSDGSSPIRPVMRKSSLNFASLPAREPLTSKKSLGPRSSRPSNDHRTSHYGKRQSQPDVAADSDADDMDIDDVMTATQDRTESQNERSNLNKTYTQRLQDQISMLGKSQPNARRQSKSTSSISAAVQPTAQMAPEPKSASPVRSPIRSPTRKEAAPPTPGAFPEDEDEDDWIAPPAVPRKDNIPSSPRPVLPKSHTADVMEGIHGVDTVGGADFVLPKQRQGDSRPGSPQRMATAPDRTTNAPGHGKSASVSVLPLTGSRGMDAASPKKGVSVSNPTVISANQSRPVSPTKSPSRSFRDSPLKQVKNKLSSIIKSSKGLLASSAVLSAEGKTAMLSPSTTRLGLHAGPSTESLFSRMMPSDALYPDLSHRTAADNQSLMAPPSPTRPVAKRTRASIEREKEEKRKEKEAQKEARLYAEQMSKLDKAREKEREKARHFSKEQEKVLAMEAKATQKEQERIAVLEAQAAQKEQERAQVVKTPAPKEPVKPTRTSPRKAKAQAEAEDVDMVDAAAAMPPPSVPRSAGPGQAIRGKEIRRPMKPTKEPVATKQAPTVIRVNTGSQHSQYRPSTAALGSSLRETLAAPQTQLRSKASQASLHTKTSMQSLKGTTPGGRPKALDLAAKRKEQEEREAQRKREAKLELEKKRQAMQEEERKVELLKRQEAERQKEKEREHAEPKKNAQRQAALEKAKQTRAPPPAVRSQPNGPPDYASGAEGPPRPVSRLATSSVRSQEDSGRPVNAVLAQGAKPATKRPLPQDASEAARNGQARNGLSYQAKEAKRRRTSDDFFDELDMESQQPNIKGPPVRPSGGFKKEMQKSVYTSGYTAAPPSASRDLFKATVTAQHAHSAAKGTQAMDMSQFSKGAIPFAPNPNAAGSHKTPARPPATANVKSTAKVPRSSPRFQNGESIELPEIETDDDDEDEEDAHLGVASWADSPDLRRALMRQETMDPGQIFGPPAPLIMEEVFNKSKDKWHKFRARTSSANWSGADRLTEDDIRKDLVARDKLRKEGAWSYEMSKDLM